MTRKKEREREKTNTKRTRMGYLVVLKPLVIVFFFFGFFLEPFMKPSHGSALIILKKRLSLSSIIQRESLVSYPPPEVFRSSVPPPSPPCSSFLSPASADSWLPQIGLCLFHVVVALLVPALTIEFLSTRVSVSRFRISSFCRTIFLFFGFPFSIGPLFVKLFLLLF